jgi:hypothetical protein
MGHKEKENRKRRNAPWGIRRRDRPLSYIAHLLDKRKWKKKECSMGHKEKENRKRRNAPWGIRRRDRPSSYIAYFLDKRK